MSNYSLLKSIPIMLVFSMVVPTSGIGHRAGVLPRPLSDGDGRSPIANGLTSNAWDFYNDLEPTRHIDFLGTSAATDDGGAVVATISYNSSYTEIMHDVVKTDSAGNVEWTTVFNGLGLSTVSPLVIQKADGGYIAAGATFSFRKHNDQAWQNDAWFTILDADGTLSRGAFIAGTDAVSPTTMFQTMDGYYIIAGLARGYFNGGDNHWIMKIAGNGEIIWSNVYNISLYANNGIWDGVASGNDGAVFTGYIGNQAVVTKIDGDGRVSEQRIITNEAGDGYLNRIFVTHDGGYLLSGSQALVKLDSELNYVYAYWLATDYLSGFEDAVALDDNGRMLLVGWKREGPDGLGLGFTSEVQVLEDGLSVLGQKFYRGVMGFPSVSKSELGYILSGIPNTQAGGFIGRIVDFNEDDPACLLSENTTYPLLPIERTVTVASASELEVDDDLETHSYPMNDPGNEHPDLDLGVEAVSYTLLTKNNYCVDPNLAPTVEAGGPYQLPEGGSVNLAASGTDPEGGPLSFAWDLTNDGTFETPGQEAVLYAGPMEAPASFTVVVQATDEHGLTATDQAFVAVSYDFTGFFQPIENPPVLNEVNGGRAVPVKFSLGGDQGLLVFAPGYPKSEAVACESTAPVNGVEGTVAVVSSSLSYDATADMYTYVWKTDKRWEGTCRQLVVKLDDGLYHRAIFWFK